MNEIEFTDESGGSKLTLAALKTALSVMHRFPAMMIGAIGYAMLYDDIKRCPEKVITGESTRKLETWDEMNRIMSDIKEYSKQFYERQPFDEKVVNQMKSIIADIENLANSEGVKI